MILIKEIYWVRYRFEKGDTDVVSSHFLSRSETAVSKSSIGGIAFVAGRTSSSSSNWTTGSDDL
jgi:hypothetical protein